MDKKAYLIFFAFLSWVALGALTQLFEFVTARLISSWNENLEKKKIYIHYHFKETISLTVGTHLPCLLSANIGKLMYYYMHIE